MGNHSIDCEFCGQDRRIVGSNCCAEYVAEEKRKQEERDRKEKEDTDFLNLYGFDGGYYHTLYKSDVVEMLKTLIELGDLKDRRRKEESKTMTKGKVKMYVVQPTNGPNSDRLYLAPFGATNPAEFRELGIIGDTKLDFRVGDEVEIEVKIKSRVMETRVEVK
jgi:hypothetical protein